MATVGSGRKSRSVQHRLVCTSRGGYRCIGASCMSLAACVAAPFQCLELVRTYPLSKLHRCAIVDQISRVRTLLISMDHFQHPPRAQLSEVRLSCDHVPRNSPLVLRTRKLVHSYPSTFDFCQAVSISSQAVVSTTHSQFSHVRSRIPTSARHASRSHQTINFSDGLDTDLAISFPNLDELDRTTLSE